MPAPLGNDIRVNTTTSSSQRLPSVTALADGGFVVTGSSYSQDGSGWGIYGQRFAADGSMVGGEFQVNQITAGDQSGETFYGSETVATLADGHLVQVWSGFGFEEVFFRLLDVSNVSTANAAPVTTDAVAGTDEDAAVNGTVVDTTSDADDDTATELSYSVVGAAPAGLVFNTDGTWSFDPAGQFDHLDSGDSAQVSFQYQADDGDDPSNVATVTITIDGVNDAPVTTDAAVDFGRKPATRAAERFLVDSRAALPRRAGAQSPKHSVDPLSAIRGSWSSMRHSESGRSPQFHAARFRKAAMNRNAAPRSRTVNTTAPNFT